MNRHPLDIVKMALVLALLVVASVARPQATAPEPASPPSAAAPVQQHGSASIVADRDQAGLGEAITVTIRIPLKVELKDIEATLPEQQKTQYFLGPLNRTDNGVYTMQVRPLADGDLFFGPLEVKATPLGADQPVVISTKELRFHVTAPPGKATEEVRDYTKPLGMAFDFFWRNFVYLAAGFLALIIFAALVFSLGRFARRRAEVARYVPPLPPIEQALKGISELKSLDVFRQQGVDQHYTSVSTVVRRYLDNQFNLAALEMTEDEVCALFRATLAYLPDTNALRDVLRRTSLAKFARQPLTEDDARQDCDVVEGFLVKEKQRLDEERRAVPQQQREDAPRGRDDRREERTA